ncbi:MAG: hypothetical protein KAY24_01885 [Candidatus Eisenbacteria sp.]|nr:hypothetical protein [Candidatus Eisenbacteria bacterium]
MCTVRLDGVSLPRYSSVLVMGRKKVTSVSNKSQTGSLEPQAGLGRSRTKSGAGFPAWRGWILAAFSILILTGFYTLPVNRSWLNRIFGYYRQLPRHFATTNHGDIMYARHGPNYGVPEYLQTLLKKDDVFLLPPIEYLKRTYSHTFWGWAEPKFFYYMLGRQRTVTLDSPDVWEATCTIVIDEKRRPRFVRIATRADLRQVCVSFGCRLP